MEPNRSLRSTDRILHGTIRQGARADWHALEDLVGTDLLSRFTWMFELELEDGARVHAYKDRITRRAVHLAEDGRAFVDTATGRYRQIDRHTAVVLVLEEPDNGYPTAAEDTGLGVAPARSRADTTPR